eukprot:gene8019-biopygen9727
MGGTETQRIIKDPQLACIFWLQTPTTHKPRKRRGIHNRRGPEGSHLPDPAEIAPEAGARQAQHPLDEEEAARVPLPAEDAVDLRDVPAGELDPAALAEREAADARAVPLLPQARRRLEEGLEIFFSDFIIGS